jgi:hypothetical protein
VYVELGITRKPKERAGQKLPIGGSRMLDLLPIKDPTCSRYIEQVRKRRRTDMIISITGLLIIAAACVWFAVEMVRQWVG